MEERKEGFDLLALLDKELKEKNITDKEVIKDYLYQRCGQIFKVDPKGAFCTPEERKVLNEQRIDIRNVTTVYLNCYSWSYAFVDLLKAKNIPAKVCIIEREDGRTHAYVEAYIKGNTYLLDLYGCYEDIMRIKFNFEPRFNQQITNNHFNNKRQIEQKESFMDKFFTEAKKSIEKIKKNCSTKEEFVYQSFKMIESIMNSSLCEENNIDYITGIQFIRTLLRQFVGRHDMPKNMHHIDKKEGIFMELYSLNKCGGRVQTYFVYQELEIGNYKLREVTKEYVEELKENSCHTENYALTRELSNSSKYNIYGTCKM